MKCFFHHDRDAIGLCKSCSRGLCIDCVAEVGEGLACRDRCEKTVGKLNKLIDRSSASYQITRNVYQRSAITYFAFGLVLLASSGIFFRGSWIIGVVMLGLGILMLLLSINYFRTALSYYRIQRDDSGKPPVMMRNQS